MPPTPPSEPPPADTITWSVVRGVWLTASLALFWLVAAHQSDIPWGDEYDVVPVATRHRPLTVEWLWSQHNEHRIPLPRLVQIIVLRLTGTDFRAGAWVVAFGLSGLALAGIALAERVRGGPSVFDAFFPLIGLHWGQVENVLWNWQIAFLLSVSLTTVVLAVVVRDATALSLRRAVLAGGCLLLLPLCGGNGLLAAVPLAAWLAAVTASDWGSPRLGGVRGSIVVIGLAGAVFAECGTYFLGFKAGAPVPDHVTASDQLEVGLAFLAVAFGPGIASSWRAESATTVVILAAVGWVLGSAGWRWAGEWKRAAGLAAVLAVCPAAAVLVGHSRTGDGAAAGLQPRYSTLWLPGWWAVYLALVVYTSGTVRQLTTASLTAIAALIVTWNVLFGLEWAEAFRAQRTDFERELDAGVPSFVLAQRYYRHPFGLFVPDPDMLDGWLMMLRDAKVGRFARMVPTPPHREEPLDGSNSSVGPEPGRIRLNPPREVLAVRTVLKAEGLEEGEQGTIVLLSWTGGPTARSVDIGVPREWDDQIVWVGGRVEEFRFVCPPGRGVTHFRLLLTVPADAPSSPAGPPGVP